jgi:hypothetical protein
MGSSLHRIITAIAYAFCLVGLVGCASSETFVVQDPSRVEVLHDNQVVLAAGSREERAWVSQASVDPVPGGHSHVQLEARRDAAGAISLVWDTKLPLVNGEEHALLTPSTDVVLANPDFTRPVLRWSACAHLLKPTYHAPAYSATVAMRACGPNDFAAEPLILETPWDNVQVRRVVGGTGRTTVAGIGYVLMMAGAGLIPAQPELLVLGISGGLIAVGGVLLGVSYLLPGSHTRMESIHPAANAASTRRHRSARRT